MPKVVDPDVDVPADVAAAAAVFATPLRLAILRVLAAGPKTAAEIAEELDLARPTLPRNIGLLEQAGVIVGAPPAGQRHRLTVTWHAQPVRIRALAQVVARYATGQNPAVRRRRA